MLRSWARRPWVSLCSASYREVHVKEGRGDMTTPLVELEGWFYH